jgi:hypothetical protein
MAVVKGKKLLVRHSRQVLLIGGCARKTRLAPSGSKAYLNEAEAADATRGRSPRVAEKG